MKQKRVWIYCRTAYPDKDALELQQERMKAYARKRRMKIVGITAEHGSGCHMSRKGLDKVYDAAKRGVVDYVLVSNISRLGRVILDTEEFVDQLKECGVRVICADGLTMDDHTGKLLRAMIEAAKAENYLPQV